jgi:hypothetical protein
MICVAFFFRRPAMVIDWFQKSLDIFILRFVEFFEFPRVSCFSVQSDWTAAIAFSRRVGAYQGHFTLGLDGGREVVGIIVFGRRCALEVISILASAVRDIAMREGVVGASCARGFNGGAGAVGFAYGDCVFGCS